MNRFILTIGVAAVTTAASIATFAGRANAQTVNSGEVEMSATIGAFCIFDNEIDGTLGAPIDDLTKLDSTLPANGITALDGAEGTVEVTCNDANAQISIDTVTESNTAGVTVDTYTTVVSGLATDMISTDGAASNAVAIGSTNTERLDVNLEATYASNLAAGEYTYTVNLVANP